MPPAPRASRDAAGARRRTAFSAWQTFILTVFALHYARDVLVPLALATFLAFLLSPVSVGLSRLGLPRTLSVIATTALAFAVLTGVAWIVGSQALSLVQELPKYGYNIERRVENLKSPHVPKALAPAASLISTLEKDLKEPTPDQSPAGGQARPRPVEIAQAKGSVIELARDVLAPVLGPLGTAGIVLIFVVAMLMQREDLRDRLAGLLASSGGRRAAEDALDDVSQRLSRYLSTQLLVNASYGVPIGLGLYFIGIPNALLWGVLSTLLRFIPYLGPWMGAAFPILVALAIDPGWSKVFMTLGLYFAAEAITANIIEVWVYGSRTGVSGIALLFAAVFWAWLWGIPGLLLSTPMTVCLMVLGKYVPGLAIFSVLLGREPPEENSSGEQAAG